MNEIVPNWTNCTITERKDKKRKFITKLWSQLPSMFINNNIEGKWYTFNHYLVM